MFYLAITQYAGFAFVVVVTYEFGLTLAQCYPVAGLNGCGIAGALLLLLHLLVERSCIDRHVMLFENQLGKVERKSVCVVERKRIFAVDDRFILSLGIVYNLIEQPDAGLQRAQESLFFLFYYFGDEVSLCRQLGICIAHRLYEHIYQPVKECVPQPQECISVAYGTAQDTAYYVAGLGIRRQLSVGYREGDGAYMVGNDAHGYVVLFVFSITFAADVADGCNNGLEDVGVVIRFLSLQSHT